VYTFAAAAACSSVAAGSIASRMWISLTAPLAATAIFRPSTRSKLSASATTTMSNVPRHKSNETNLTPTALQIFFTAS
jgi:multisubunit Na+/H+ antiporter MnhG subunit